MLTQKERMRSFIIGWSVVYGAIFAFQFRSDSLYLIETRNSSAFLSSMAYFSCFPLTIFLAFYFYCKERYNAAWWICFLPLLWTPIFFWISMIVHLALRGIL